MNITSVVHKVGWNDLLTLLQISEHKSEEFGNTFDVLKYDIDYDYFRKNINDILSVFTKESGFQIANVNEDACFDSSDIEKYLDGFKIKEQ